MNAEPRTVAVPILVIKPLEVDEPAWCVDPHTTSQFKADIVHNGPEIAAEIDTRHGTITYLTAWITTAPFGILRPEPLPVVAIEIDGSTTSFTPEEVRAFTDTTRAHLDQLDRLADEANHLRGGGQ
ncbi:DUF6907 domain-containing protein [Streptomyces sp. NPDC058045]|uniref:DUF6907 domain-containing protein n=1 Tax=Streptomyces sp. NPDC058045 TaxID=3346311 RepID=UPI0036ECF4D3